MKPELKKKFRKIVLLLVLGFIVLFAFRFIYGFTKSNDHTSDQTPQFDDMSSGKRNYASKEYKVQSTNESSSPVKVDQKYEKIAEIKTKSGNFEEEERQTRKQIEKYNAIIQFEQKSGNIGSRNLDLLIGVPPENFDSLYSSLIIIGKVQGKQITKKDKTNEYKELNAKKNSLVQIRTSLIELKSKGGKIEEYMQLENRILEIEEQLQELGVSLGDFDSENEFCTVKYSLQEGHVSSISIFSRIKVALEWTVKMYLYIMVLVFFLTLSAYLILFSIEKLKILERIFRKMTKE